jgi:hypothetical protein
MIQFGRLGVVGAVVDRSAAFQRAFGRTPSSDGLRSAGYIGNVKLNAMCFGVASDAWEER